MTETGEIKHPDDGNNGNGSEQQKREFKRLKYVQDMSKPITDGQGILSSSPHTSELGGTPTRKLEGTSTHELSTLEWRQKQFEVMTDYWRKSGQLGEAKRRADALGVDLTPGVTKELQNETTQKLEESKQQQHRADELGIDLPSAYESLPPAYESLPPAYTSLDHSQEWQIEATQKPEVNPDIKQIAKVPEETKAKNRKSGNWLPMDQMRHVYRPINNP